MKFWYLFSAYTIIWLVLFGYLLKLGRANRRLKGELDTLKEILQLQSSKPENPS